jgi:hypothetical protein
MNTVQANTIVQGAFVSKCIVHYPYWKSYANRRAEIAERNHKLMRAVCRKIHMLSHSSHGWSPDFFISNASCGGESCGRGHVVAAAPALQIFECMHVARPRVHPSTTTLRFVSKKRAREREREILRYSLIFSYYTPYYTFIVHEHNRVLHGWRLIFEGYEWCVESVISCIYAYILFRASYCKMREPSAKHFALMRNHIAGGTKMHVARFLCKDSSATDTCNASCAGVFMRSGHARSWSCC